MQLDTGWKCDACERSIFVDVQVSLRAYFGLRLLHKTLVLMLQQLHERIGSVTCRECLGEKQGTEWQ